MEPVKARSIAIRYTVLLWILALSLPVIGNAGCESNDPQHASDDAIWEAHGFGPEKIAFLHKRKKMDRSAYEQQLDAYRNLIIMSGLTVDEFASWMKVKLGDRRTRVIELLGSPDSETTDFPLPEEGHLALDAAMANAHTWLLYEGGVGVIKRVIGLDADGNVVHMANTPY